MQAAVEGLSAYSKKLTVTISPEDLQPFEKKVLKNYQRNSEVKGFRKGHAPMNIIRQRYATVIQQDLIEEALREYYGKAIMESGLDPVSEGKISNFEFESIDSGMKFEIEVEVEPEIEIKKHKGLKVEKDVVEVTDEMVEDSLERLREQFATVKELEQAAEGHFVFFNAQELDAGDVPIVGHKYDNLQAQLGSGKFDPAIEKQLIGVKKDEKRIVTQEIPPAPDQKDKAPQQTRLEIQVTRIEEKEFPELNDDFVKNLQDDNLENLEQLRERIRENLVLDFQYRNEQSFTNRLIDELLKENPFEVPPSMVENYLNEMVKDVQKQSEGKPINEDAIRKEYRASAVHHLRWYFLRKKLMEMENISVSNEEAVQMVEESSLDEKAKNQAKTNQHYLNHLKEDLLEKKILDLLKKHAEVVEVYPLKQTAETAEKKK